MATSPRRSSSELRMGKQGRLVIPADARRQLGFDEGERLSWRIVDDELVITTFRSNLERIRRELREGIPSGSDPLAEFFAERRRDAKREATE